MPSYTPPLSLPTLATLRMANDLYTAADERACVA
jgi:hypothetical protein